MTEHQSDPSPSADPPFKDGVESFGSFYPKHYVLAVYADDAASARAGDALRAVGFAADDVVVMPGAEIAAHAKTAIEHQGVLTRLREEWSRLYTDGAAGSQRLVDLAERGCAFVLAYAPDDAQMARAADALRPLGPEVLKYYGTFTVTDLL